MMEENNENENVPQIYENEALEGEYGAPTSQEVMGNVNQALELYSRCKEVTEKRKAVEAWSKVKIKETALKYKACQEMLNHTYGERDKALSKYYALLDKAVDEDNNELILSALKGISGIVTSSPLEDFEKFVEIWNDTSQPLFDF